MIREYLAGNLSPAEMYLVEDRLLESDFHFEAMEGLERVPWSTCQTAVDESSRKIREHFKIKPNPSWGGKKILMAASVVVILGLGIFWLTVPLRQQTIDLSGEATPQLPSAGADIEASNDQLPAAQDSVTSQNDTVLTRVNTTPPEVLASTTTTTEKAPDPYQIAFQDPLAVTHMAIGRVVDIQGTALQNVMVSIGDQTDHTNKNGYYAIKVVAGTTNLSINYSGFNDQREVDTSADWEIVLDIQKQKIVENYPITGVNRFK